MKIFTSGSSAGACLMIALLACMPAAAQQAFPRYPARLPDWFWDSPSAAHPLSSEDILELRHDFVKSTDLGLTQTFEQIHV